MMKSLAGWLLPTELDLVNSMIKLRFENSSRFMTADSVIIYEQRMLPEDVLFKCCMEEQGVKLEKPKMSYLSNSVIEFYTDYECVPFKLDTVHNKLHVMVIIENKNKPLPEYESYEVVKHFVPLYYYVELRTRYYGSPKWLLELAIKDVFEFIVNEAITLGAIDITISSRRDCGVVYYNVRKKKVYSKRSITKENVLELTRYISTQSGAAFEESDLEPKYMNTELDVKHRGRTCIKDTIWGKTITIRVLNNEPLEVSLEDLNLAPQVVDFIRNVFMDTSKNGLRLIVGPTMSGKNTSIVAMIREMILEDDKKINTVEMPVEIFLENVEQTSVDDENLYNLNAMALLRENPDICYLSEITDRTAETILVTANTAKPVYSTLHANDIPGIISRLVDLTNFSIDRVIETLHSVIFQQLVRDDENDMLYPKNICFEFTNKVKLDLFGKSLGELQEYFSRDDLNIIYS